VSLGNCWPFQGSRGQAVIRLPAQIQATAVTIHHTSQTDSAFGTFSSAPRDFTISVSLCWALGAGTYPGKALTETCWSLLDEEGEEETLLGSFTYNMQKEPVQTFPLQVQSEHNPRAFQFIKLVIQSNWGNPEYTCIYRVQVHGKRTATTHQPEDMR
ncbi:SPAG4 protein, partial [Chauna torquata]|nr:SPAG4 protein [Chauna torquata]